MRKVLLYALMAFTSSFAYSADKNISQSFPTYPTALQRYINEVVPTPNYSKRIPLSLEEIKNLLYLHSDVLNPDVIKTVLTTIECTQEFNIRYSNILTIIDYSLPADKKRLWIFDLRKKQLLYNTYVSHGIKSGTLTTTYFSNKVGSQASSLGLFTTGKTYYGRHGLSLKLDGLDQGFNSNANQRNIVMHAAWYVDNAFIAKYGRAGRSWGCPAVPEDIAIPIMNLIKNKSLFVIYYPSNQWLLSSKFLHCNKASLKNGNNNDLALLSLLPSDDYRGAIFFADNNNNNKREEYEPVMVMETTTYQRIYNTPVPLERMLRARINNTEYIALNNQELKSLDSDYNNIIDTNDKYGLSILNFVVPVVKKIKGYYATQFEFVNLGTIQQINITDPNYVILRTDKSSINLKPNNYFIRWVGL